MDRELTIKSSDQLEGVLQSWAEGLAAAETLERGQRLSAIRVTKAEAGLSKDEMVELRRRAHEIFDRSTGDALWHRRWESEPQLLRLRLISQLERLIARIDDPEGRDH